MRRGPIALVILLSVATVRAESGVLILTSDFATGSTAYLAAGSSAAEVNLLGIHGDAVGHYQDGLVYIVNRLGQDNVLVLDPADLRTPVAQFSVGNGTNPHDLEVVAPDKAYVTRHDTTSLLIVDPRDGRRLGQIDLSAYADGDGLPEMSQIARVGDRLYVSCLRLDRNNGFAPAGPGVLVAIDPATDAIVGDLALSAPNPNRLVVLGDRIAVGLTAGFGDRAGGIEVVDTRAGRSLGLAITEEALGGDLSAFVLRTPTRGWAVVLDESFANVVKPVDLATGEVGAPLEGLSGGYIPALAIDGDRLLVGDQGSFGDPAGAGLKIYDAATGAFLAGPIRTGLPPYDIVVLADATITAVTGTLGGARPDASRLDPAYPNPFNASVRIPFAVARAHGAVTLDVCDVLGRRVRRLLAQPLAAGGYEAAWDGRDDAGAAVGNGTYLVRLEAGGGRAQGKVLLLK